MTYLQLEQIGEIREFKTELSMHFPKMEEWKWLYVAAAAEYKRRLGFVGLVCPIVFKFHF